MSNKENLPFNKPLVSIIIPVYNSAEYLDDCIESLLSQTYSEIEIVLCDDCSTDNSRDVLKKYESNSRIKILYNEKNMRQAATRNRCLQVCSGQYIAIQDSDDVSKHDRIEKLFNALTNSEQISFVGSSCYLFDDFGIYSSIPIRNSYPKRIDLLRGIPFVHASIMFKKDVLNSVGGYRVSKMTERGEDYDLIMRLYSVGFLGMNINEELYGYRVDKNTYARRTLKSRISEMKIRYHGYKANNILFPWGIFYVLKPIPAFFYQLVKINLLNMRNV